MPRMVEIQGLFSGISSGNLPEMLPNDNLAYPLYLEHSLVPATTGTHKSHTGEAP